MPLAAGSFENKVALITGSSSGIGAATAVYFASLGASVFVTGRNEDRLKDVVKKCQEASKASSEIVDYVVGDITNDDFIKVLVDKTVSRFGKLDILVNNAGVTSPFGQITHPDAIKLMDRIINTNLRPYYIASHYAIEHLVKTEGCIINVSSVLSATPDVNNVPYCTVKAGIDHFTRCIALFLGNKKVRVNTVNPGVVATGITELFFNEAQIPKEQHDGLFNQIGESFPLKRNGTPEEVAQAIGYLASKDASWITGTNLLMDGGMSFTGLPSIK